MTQSAVLAARCGKTARFPASEALENGNDGGSGRKLVRIFLYKSDVVSNCFEYVSSKIFEKITN